MFPQLPPHFSRLWARRTFRRLCKRASLGRRSGAGLNRAWKMGRWLWPAPLVTTMVLPAISIVSCEQMADETFRQQWSRRILECPLLLWEPRHDWWATLSWYSEIWQKRPNTQLRYRLFVRANTLAGKIVQVYARFKYAVYPACYWNRIHQASTVTHPC